MDLRKLTTQIAERNRKNVILTFERGQVVVRTHSQLRTDVAAACARLEQWDVKSGQRVGIWAHNCYEWIVYDLALLELRALSVAFTDDFVGKSADTLIDSYSLSLLLISTANKERRTARHSASIAFLDATNQAVQAIPRELGTQDPDFATTGLVFSSGSSGKLKGLVLSRQGIEASVDAFTGQAKPRPDDCLLLFLPISNFQQRLMYYSALWYGFDLIVTDPTRLFRALKDLKPTILIAPPMLYEAFETRFYNLPRWKQSMARYCGAILGVLPAQKLRESVARVLFKDAYEALGTRMRFMVTGMAPTKRSTLELFRLMQLPLFETYGMTEFGGIALNIPGENRPGSVGRLLPGVRVELAPDGEVIAIREHRIASTYFECAESDVEQTFIGPDRVATGDIGRFDEEGYLYLVGRKKEMIITAGGNKIHPEIPEAELDACPDIGRSVVFADPDAPGLLAVVVPKAVDNETAKIRIRRFVDDLNERQTTMMIGKIIFSEQSFSRENGFLLPNLKLNRKMIAQQLVLRNNDSASAIGRSA